MPPTNVATYIPNSTTVGPTADSAGDDFFKMFTRITYCVVLLVGLFGNLLTCFAIIRTKFMRRAIHFYTFNLAAADLVLLVMYVPTEMVRNEHDLRWTMGKALCHVNYCLIPISLMASIGTLVAITLDRHRGVTRPFHWRGDSRRSIKIVIPLIWCFSIICSAPVTAVATLIEFPARSGEYYCYENWNSRHGEIAYWTIMAIVQVGIPLCIIAAANFHMLIVILRDSDSSAHKTHHKKMIRMVITLVLVYAICSSPQHIFFFWMTFGNLTQLKEAKAIFKVSNFLIILQAALNPIIYGTSRQDFKRSFKSILRCTHLRVFCGENLDSEDDSSCPSAARDTRYTLTTFSEAPGGTQPVMSRDKKHSKLVTDTPPLPRKEDSSQAHYRQFSTPEDSRVNAEPRRVRFISVFNNNSTLGKTQNGRPPSYESVYIEQLPSDKAYNGHPSLEKVYNEQSLSDKLLISEADEDFITGSTTRDKQQKDKAASMAIFSNVTVKQNIGKCDMSHSDTFDYITDNEWGLPEKEGDVAGLLLQSLETNL